MLLTFLLRPASDHHFCSFVTYAFLGFFSSAVAGSINLPINSKGIDTFHCTGFEYSRLDWDGFINYIRNMQRDVLNIGASAAGTDF